VEVHVVDGTYELFRHYFAVPPAQDRAGREVGAVRGVLRSLLAMLRDGATHMGVATDHVIESFRNQLWPGYKTGEGVPADLLAQFEPLEEGIRGLGIVVWPMVEVEADDALASAAARAAGDKRVQRVYICTPDKDLAQSVVGDRVVQLDRRKLATRDAKGVEAKFGVPPASIPDYLALVGDSSDGFPGVRGWGPKSTAAVLARFGHLEAIPESPAAWGVRIPNATALGTALRAHWDQALLFRHLATLRTDVPVFETVDDLAWSGPVPTFESWSRELGDPELWQRARAEAARRAQAARSE
jgi:5'-3' exonuclease